jgi:heme-degrading monooxygenase HmoA
MPGITVINSFEVPAGREDEFLRLWKIVNAYVKRKPGYLGHKLHRSIAPHAPFRFVNVGEWASMAQFEAAHDAGFRELIENASWSGFAAHRVLFEVIHEGHAYPLGLL